MNYQPPCTFIRLYQVDYSRLMGRIRQKMSQLNAKLIELNRVSGMRYYLYIDADTLTLVNVTYNRVVFSIPADQSFAICSFKLDNLLEMHRLEHAPFATIYEQNHYLSLKQQFYP